MAMRKRGKQENSDKPDEYGHSKTFKKKTYKKEGHSTVLKVTVLLITLVMVAALTYCYSLGGLKEVADSFLNPQIGKQSVVETPQTEKLNAERKTGEGSGVKKKKESSSPKKKKRQKDSITNKKDAAIRGVLDAADSFLEKGQLREALSKFDEILAKYPISARANYGKAQTLDKMADNQKSNAILEQAIAQYLKVLDLPDVPDDLVMMAGKRCADRQKFRGWSAKSAKTINALIERFPHNVDLKNELGVAMLLQGRNSQAEVVFKQVLEHDPDNAFAQVHLGFIIKTIHSDNERGVELMRSGLAKNDPSTNHGRFYFHLGDALQRLNRTEEAYEVYEEATQKGHFKSAYQRSLYNINSLSSRPWWTPEQTTYKKHLKLLEDNWKIIRDEGLSNMDVKKGLFQKEDENLSDTGDWRQFTLYSQGQRKDENCKKAPKTCALVDKIVEAKSCKRGQIKFSVMQPGVHVWPHCGPTNCRIRAHLGLVVPDGPKIRVKEDIRTWKEGKFIIFDDSFEHEVWHDGTSFRLVLIIDFWHPELTAEQKRSLTPI